MNCYKAKPISRENIKRYVRYIKKKTGFEDELYFPIIDFMENVLPEWIDGFNYEIVSKQEMGSLHGETFPNKNLIRIREDVYERAVAGEGRDRLTIAHEIGHLLFHEEDSVALCRMDPNEKLKPYEDPEWQAMALAAEIMCDARLVRHMSPDQIKETCGVSWTAANRVFENCRKL